MLTVCSQICVRQVHSCQDQWTGVQFLATTPMFMTVLFTERRCKAHLSGQHLLASSTTCSASFGRPAAGVALTRAIIISNAAHTQLVALQGDHCRCHFCLRFTFAKQYIFNNLEVRESLEGWSLAPKEAASILICHNRCEVNGKRKSMSASQQISAPRPADQMVHAQIFCGIC